MTIMEPDLILQPILERAIPSLETLVEVMLSCWLQADTDVPRLAVLRLSSKHWVLLPCL